MRVSPPRSSVSLSSLFAFGTCSAFAIKATRRSVLAKVSKSISGSSGSLSSSDFAASSSAAITAAFAALSASMLSLLSGCAQSQANEASSEFVSETYNSIYWSDGDSGRLGKLKFRLANIDAPETGSLKQRGGAKCESERELGYEAKAFIVKYTKDKMIRIVRDYGEDRYGRLVVDLQANGSSVASAGVKAGYLKEWLHINGRAKSPKPDWCE